MGCSAEKGSFLGTEAWWTITSEILSSKETSQEMMH